MPALATREGGARAWPIAGYFASRQAFFFLFLLGETV